jgi:hypothetical protein
LHRAAAACDWELVACEGAWLSLSVLDAGEHLFAGPTPVMQPSRARWCGWCAPPRIAWPPTGGWLLDLAPVLARRLRERLPGSCWRERGGRRGQSQRATGFSECGAERPLSAESEWSGGGCQGFQPRGPRSAGSVRYRWPPVRAVAHNVSALPSTSAAMISRSL